MADLTDLNYKSISEMSYNEALELLAQIRLSRRTPKKRTKSKSTSKRKPKKVPQVNQTQAAELLKLLGGSK